MRAPLTPERGQVGFDRVGAALAKRDVVFARAAFIAVAFDLHLHARILFQPGGLSLKGRAALVRAACTGRVRNRPGLSFWP